MEFKRLGYNLYRTLGTPIKGKDIYHYITLHLCPHTSGVDKDYHILCSCKGFTINTPRNCGNSLVDGCKHTSTFEQLMDTITIGGELIETVTRQERVLDPLRESAG